MTWLIWGICLPRSGHGCLKLMAVIKAIGDTATSLCRSKIIISKSREPFSISFFLALFLPSVSNYGAALLTLMLKSYSLLPEKTKWSLLMIQGTNHFKCVIKFANWGLVVRSFDVSHNFWPDVYFLWHCSRLTLEPGVRGVFWMITSRVAHSQKHFLVYFPPSVRDRKWARSRVPPFSFKTLQDHAEWQPVWLLSLVLWQVWSTCTVGFMTLASSPLNGSGKRQSINQLWCDNGRGVRWEAANCLSLCPPLWIISRAPTWRRTSGKYSTCNH